MQLQLGARAYRNGGFIDQTQETFQEGQQLVEFDYRGTAGWTDSLCQGGTEFRGTGSRSGGDDMCEVILFKERLTEAERLNVEAYLMKKWQVTASVVPNFKVARGATLETDLDLVASGEGVIRTMAGSVTVPDALVGAPFSGEVALAGGDLYAFDETAVALAPDTTVSASRLEGCDKLTATAGAGAGMVKKDKAGRLRVHAVPTTVQKVEVASGTFTLASTNTVTTVLPGTNTYALIEDGDFESYTSRGFDTKKEPATVCGWTYGSSDLSQDYYAFIWNVVEGANSWGLPKSNLIAAHGKCILVLRGQSFGRTDVRIVRDGTYELSFATAKRADQQGGVVEVWFGEDKDHLSRVTCATPLTETYFVYQTARISNLVARDEPYVLEFRSVRPVKYYCPFIDDVKMRLVSTVDTEIPLPNGGFEQSYTNFNYSTVGIDRRNKTAGWTVAPDSASVALAYPGQTNSVGALFQRSGDLKDGRVSLFVGATGVTVSTTFKVPAAGRYRLRTDMGAWFNNDRDAYPKLFASVKVGQEAPLSLGAVTTSGQRLDPFTWETSFAVADADQLIVLALTNGVNRSGAMIDNLRLVPLPETGLLANGFFEEDEAWEFASVGTSAYCHALYRAYSSYSAYYGRAICEGQRSLQLTDQAVATQTVDFPTAGAYQLRFHLAERDDSRYALHQKGLCDYRAWIARGGVTNVIGVDTANTTNFVGRLWTFKVPTAGTWTFGFEAANTDKGNRDRTVFIDAASITPYAGGEAPEVHKDLAIDVVAGAKLRLDYPGTNRIESLKLGGRSVVGVITSAAYPDFVFGAGALEVRARGTILLIR